MRVAAWKAIAHSLPAHLRSLINHHLFQFPFGYANLPVDPWCGSLAYMQREGNCPLNARARALGAVKEAIAYSMAALLLAEKLGTFI